jgi:hypothetical protein
VGRSLTIRNVALAVLGACVLVLKVAYQGPFEEAVYAWAGNLAVSFALYFALLNTTMRWSRPRLYAAGFALLAVEAFEATNGFGVMTNVYDPVDFLANAAGVGLAVVVDVVTARAISQRSESIASR